MADQEDIQDIENGADVEMDNGEEVIETVQATQEDAEDGEEAPTGLENTFSDIPERAGFVDYLKSPIIEIIVGNETEQATLHAHQAFLLESPFFKNLIDAFSPDVTQRRIELLGEDVPAVAAVLEWLYKKDYFPTLTGPSNVETDPSLPHPDSAGVGLLRHARVYTLAKRFGLPALTKMAHKKIHCTGSTASGELAYAQYVYGHTQPEDTEIRKPIAQFWATRSHVLRHEAEHEFRTMCLQFPQFGFDVLSLVLDAQEKRTAKSEGSQISHAQGRKRARVSQG